MSKLENQIGSITCISLTIGALVTVAIIAVILLAVVVLDECGGALRLPNLCQCEPTIVLSPNSGRAGTTIVVRGSGWEPNTLVLFYLEQVGNATSNYPMLYGPTSDGTGSFSFRLELPSASTLEALGGVTVIARAKGGFEAQAVFDIIRPRQLVTGQIGQPLLFDANGSMDIDGLIASCDWGFGDGQTGNGCYVQHVYDVPGTYMVTLTVTDNRGLKDTAILEAMVVGLAAPNQPPLAVIRAVGGGSGQY